MIIIYEITIQLLFFQKKEALSLVIGWKSLILH
jgi:hypothetical protein